MTWQTYFEKTRNRNRHPILAYAVSFIKAAQNLTIPKTLRAADLGCGTGGDTLYLLKEGFDVTAVDAEAEAMKILLERIYESNLRVSSPNQKIRRITAPMERANLVVQLDLITSNLALPYVHRSSFTAIWSKIVQYLRFGGIFSGQFFGKETTWSSDAVKIFHDAGELKALFNNGLFRVLHFAEFQEPMRTALQEIQFRHQYDVVAVRVPLAPERPIFTAFQLFELYKSKKSEMELNEGHDVDQILSQKMQCLTL